MAQLLPEHLHVECLLLIHTGRLRCGLMAQGVTVTMCMVGHAQLPATEQLPDQHSWAQYRAIDGSNTLGCSDMDKGASACYALEVMISHLLAASNITVVSLFIACQGSEVLSLCTYKATRMLVINTVANGAETRKYRIGTSSTVRRARSTGTLGCSV